MPLQLLPGLPVHPPAVAVKRVDRPQAGDLDRHGLIPADEPADPRRHSGGRPERRPPPEPGVDVPSWERVAVLRSGPSLDRFDRGAHDSTNRFPPLSDLMPDEIFPIARG